MRRISPGTVMVFVIAILAGLLGAFVIKQMLRQPAEASTPADMVVVSRVNLSENQLVNRRVLELRPLRAGESNADAIKSTDVAAGRYVRHIIPAQTPITEKMLHDIGENPIKRLVERVSDGMRARTIQVEGLVYGSTLIRHDTMVDIAITIETDHPEVQEVGMKGIGTKTLMRNIRVLAVINPPESPRSSVTLNQLTSIVVEVTPDQANSLTLAQKIGSLSVSVVGRGDAGPGAQDDVVTPNDLVGLRLPTPPAPPPLPPPLPPLPPEEPEEVFQVEHYKGNQIQIQTFGPDQIDESRNQGQGNSVRPRFRSSRSIKRPQKTTSAASTEPVHRQISHEQPVSHQEANRVAEQGRVPPPEPVVSDRPTTGGVIVVENMSSYVSDLNQLPGSHEIPNSFVNHPDFVAGYNAHPTSSYVSDFNQLPGSYELPNSHDSYSGLLPGFNEQPSSYVNRSLESYVEAAPVAPATRRDGNFAGARRADASPTVPATNVASTPAAPVQTEAQPAQPTDQRNQMTQQQRVTQPLVAAPEEAPAVQHRRRVSRPSTSRTLGPDASLTERIYVNVRRDQKQSLYSRFEN